MYFCSSDWLNLQIKVGLTTYANFMTVFGKLNHYSFKKNSEENMKTLYLIRHAKSSWGEIGSLDIDRSLDERGHRDAPKMAQKLKDLGVKPSLILTSPAKRAFTTAQYFAKAFQIADESIVVEDDIYEADVTDIQYIVKNLPAEARTVLMFGHNPTFTYFANIYNDEIIDNLPTCGVVKIDVGTEGWSKFSENTANVVDYFFPKNI